jgi:hypothetical protein
MTPEISNIIHIVSAVVVVGLIIYTIVNRAYLNQLIDDAEANEVTIQALRSELGLVRNTSSNLEKRLNDCKKELDNSIKSVTLKDIKIAELSSRVDVLHRENKKLLVAASDDVTINVKAADDAKIVSENPRPKKKYYKKKNGGPTSNNNKTGEKK